MAPQENERPFADWPATAAELPAALIDTTLYRACITVLHPNRIVIVGDGQRLRIDHRGVTRQGLIGVRLALPMSHEATVDGNLQGTLARWAGNAAWLHVHEVVRSGEQFTRTVHLSDVSGERATLDHCSGRTAA